MAWSDLPGDLVRRISSKISLFQFLRFSAVCKSWNSALANDDLHPIRRPHSPWLLLPSDAGEAWDTLTFRDFTVEEGGDGCHRRFSSLGSHISGRRCMGSKDGWLVTVDRTDLQPRLFNPLTKAELFLPSLFTIPEDKQQRMKPRYAPDGSIEIFYNEIVPELGTPADIFRDVYFEKIVLSSNNPLGTAVVIYGYFKLLALLRPGDKAWVLGPEISLYNTDRRPDYFEDVYYHQEDQKFYAITHTSSVLAFDLNGQNIKLVCPSMKDLLDRYSEYSLKNSNCRNYITFLSGTLLKIERDIQYVDESLTGKTTRISVFKPVSVVTYSEWLPVKDLGDYSLFVGYNHTFSLHHTAALGIKPNCIYFTNHSDYLSQEDGDVGFFDLHNNCFQYFRSPDSQPNWPPSIWFTPSLS